jgi:hypothetical protein
MSLLLLLHLLTVTWIQFIADLEEFGVIAPGGDYVLYHFEIASGVNEDDILRDKGEKGGAMMMMELRERKNSVLRKASFRSMPSFEALREVTTDARLSDEP